MDEDRKVWRVSEKMRALAELTASIRLPHDETMYARGEENAVCYKLSHWQSVATPKLLSVFANVHSKVVELLDKHLNGEIDVFAEAPLCETLKINPRRRTSEQSKGVLPILKHILAEKWLFNFSGSKVFNEIMHWLVLKEYNEGEVVYAEGEPGDTLHVLVTGQVELVTPAPTPYAAETIKGPRSKKTFYDIMSEPDIPETKQRKAARKATFMTSRKAFKAAVTNPGKVARNVQEAKGSTRAGEDARRSKVLGTHEQKRESLAYEEELGADGAEEQVRRNDPVYWDPDKHFPGKGDASIRTNSSNSESSSAAQATPTVLSPFYVFGQQSVLSGKPRIQTACAKTHAKVLEISGVDFRAIVHSNTTTVEQQECRVNFIKASRPLTYDLTDRMVHALAAQFLEKTIPKDMLFPEDNLTELHLVTGGTLQVISFRPGIFDNPIIVKDFKEKSIDGLVEGKHYEILGVLTEQGLLAQGALFPKCKVGLALRALEDVDCLYIDTAQLKRFLRDTNMETLKKEAYAKLKEYNEISIWPLDCV